jgi:hypothetical protein
MAEKRKNELAAGTPAPAPTLPPAASNAGVSSVNQGVFTAEDPWLARKKTQAVQKNIDSDVNNLF